MNFKSFSFSPELIQALDELNYHTLTPIQRSAIPAVRKGKDVLASAQTGTGKTAAFALPIIQKLTESELSTSNAPHALVLAPTRELAEQIANNFKAYAKHTALKVVSLFGGVNTAGQANALKDGVDVVVATPGRLLDHIRLGNLSLASVKHLVLDEADRMLDMGFIPDVKRIVRATPTKDIRQTLLYSATFNFDVRILIDQWTTNPHKVVIEPEQITTDRVDQKLYLVAETDKYSILERVLAEEKPERLIIFANRRDLTRNLCDKLNKNGHSAALLSGEVSQEKRIRTLERFREGRVNIMVATDVAGRGIHVDGVSHVINYTLPEDPEDYVHRIGRTGRAGAKGVSVSLVSEDDAFCLPDLEKYLGTKLELTQP